jgi:hypothetical protein
MATQKPNNRALDDLIFCIDGECITAPATGSKRHRKAIQCRISPIRISK